MTFEILPKRTAAVTGDPGGDAPEAATDLEELAEGSQDLLRSISDLTGDALRRTLDLNLPGTVFPSPVLGQFPVKRGDGAMVNISSINAYQPQTQIPAYWVGTTRSFAIDSDFTEWFWVDGGFNAHSTIEKLSHSFIYE